MRATAFLFWLTLLIIVGGSAFWILRAAGGE
jgi:hypothetical protein